MLISKVRDLARTPPSQAPSAVRPPVKVPTLSSAVPGSQAVNELNAYYASAAASKAHLQAAGGMEWATEPASDASTTEGVRFTAALTLRNLGVSSPLVERQSCVLLR